MTQPTCQRSRCQPLHAVFHVASVFRGGKKFKNLRNRVTVLRSLFLFRCGGVPVSTWALTVKEHAGAPEVLVKTGKHVIGNDYALAA